MATPSKVIRCAVQQMPDANVIALDSADKGLAEERRSAIRISVAVRGGDAGAEAELVERYSRGLRYLLLRRTGDEERAKDLLQETLLIALEKLRTTDLENPERLAGYLRGIAIRVAMNAGRKRHREPSAVDVEEIVALPDTGPRQFELISSEQSAAAVRRLLDTMPVERDRDLLIRYFLRDEGKADICAALKLSSLHFNRVLFRAKARFRKILEEAGSVDIPPGG